VTAHLFVIMQSGPIMNGIPSYGRAVVVSVIGLPRRRRPFSGTDVTQI
jgi:hypothetical protein